MSKTIIEIENRMARILNADQMAMLHTTLCELLPEAKEDATTDYIALFIAAKRVEGCSEKTIRYYESTLRNVVASIAKCACDISTDDLRLYLDHYQNNSRASKITIDNIRRILSSFYSWLEDENYIIKS